MPSKRANKAGKFVESYRLCRVCACEESFKALGKFGEVPANLQSSIDGETFEVNEMYPVYNNAAEFQGEKEAVRTTHYALEAEKIHAGMYTKALIWLNR